jgi:PRTRC genetic system protein B
MPNENAPIIGELPPLPAYAMGSLMFLRGGDFLWQYRKEISEYQGRISRVFEGATFVTIQDVQNSLGGADIDTGWIERGILRCGYCAEGDWFVYHAEAQKKTLQVRMENGRVRKLTLPLPPTVLIGVGRRYYLFAVPGELSPGSSLAAAPFPNIHDSGLICWGQNVAPRAHHRHAGTAWRLFFESPFNGDLANGKSKKYAQDVRRMLAEVARGKTDRYPADDLVTRPYGSPDSLVHALVGTTQLDAEA